MPPSEPRTDDRIVLEKNERLSRSLLWRLQRGFFDQKGVEAWSQGTVPHYVTSNPWLAGAYARVIFGWLRDLAATGDPECPVYVLELGCGSGRLGYRFLKRLEAILECSALAAVPLRYVLSDYSEKNVDYLRTHPWLKPFAESGRLDFAVFDAVKHDELRLLESGDVLSPGTLENPLAVLANYVFDSIPQDCFVISDGQLYENLVSLTAPPDKAELDSPELLEELEVSYEVHPVEADYYGEEVPDRILGEYTEQLDETTVLFPCAAVLTIENLLSLSGGHLLLLSSDKGQKSLESLEGRGDPHLNLHGSFSMMVNYHALGRYVTHHGGGVLENAHPHTAIHVCAYLLGATPGEMTETRLAFHDAVGQLGPDDFFAVKKGFEKTYGSFTLPQLLAYLRLSGFDSNIFLGCLDVLKERVQTTRDSLREELRSILRQVWEMHFPIGEPHDLAFEIGTLLYEMRYFDEAMEFMGCSIELYGMSAGSAYNMALCYFHLEQFDEALEWADRSLEIDPVFEAAGVLRIKVRLQLEDRKLIA